MTWSRMWSNFREYHQPLFCNLCLTYNESFIDSLYPPPLHLFGRDDYVEKITETIRTKALSGAGARLVIGGPGGIGKTSVALAIFHSTELDTRIPRTRRFFIPCQSVTATSTFLSAIASSLDVNITEGDALKLVINKLKAGSTPLMLVLDNAESFWFDHGVQPRARTILRQICSIPTVTLLLTIRGTERPNVTVWDPLPPLSPLTPLHAQDAFLQIATDLEPDASLDNLLKMVDYVPLAVNLLARRCQIMGETAASLCSRWEREHIELLKLGGGEADDNIDVSIKLSLDSPLMRGNGNALRLLGVVSHLPAGLSDEACSSISLSDVELSAAEFLLQRLSLTYSPTPGWVTTLEPIRAYVRQQSHLQFDDLRAIETWHMGLACTHGHYKPSDTEFVLALKLLTANGPNISFILHSHLQQRNNPAAPANAVLAFSSFLYRTRPNGDLLKMLLSSGMDDIGQDIKGRCLRLLGDNLYMQDQYEEARSKLEEARLIFIDNGDRSGAAQCLKSLGNILRVQNQYEEARSKLEHARLIFIDIGDRSGAAYCLRNLGKISRMQNQYEEARSKLEDARLIFVDVGDQSGAADCLHSLGDILRMRNQYEEARTKLEDARLIFIDIGDRSGAAYCLQSLGEIFRMQNQYEEARPKLEDARLIFIEIGDQSGAADCLHSLGDILRMQNQYEEARSKLEDARLIFVDIGGRSGAAYCLQSLGEILRMQNQYEEARPKLEDARLIFVDIGGRSGAAYCLQSLGEILRMQNQYEEARLKLEDARSIFADIGNQLGAAQCLQSLGNISGCRTNMKEPGRGWRKHARFLLTLAINSRLRSAQKISRI